MPTEAPASTPKRRAVIGTVWHRLRHDRLVHFVLAGALLFAVAPAPRATGEIRVSERQQLTVFARRARLANKEKLTPDEERTALEDWLREELLYREGIRLGLDRDDTVVRRRIVQKMQFLFEDMADAGHPPIETELRAYHQQHAERWRSSAAIDFVHVFVSESGHPGDARKVAQQLKAQLESNASLNPMKLGDGFIEERTRKQARRSTVAATFGEDFADKVFGLPVGGYEGPVESPFGWHIIRVDKAYAGEVLDFETVRKQVTTAYRKKWRAEEHQRHFAELLRRHPIALDGDGHHEVNLDNGAAPTSEAVE